LGQAADQHYQPPIVKFRTASPARTTEGFDAAEMTRADHVEGIVRC
jgi:hypothetical protein